MILVLAIVALACAAIPCLLLLWNLFLYREPPKTSIENSTSVSVLIPARNEEENIRQALESVLASRGTPFEVLVLDDNSTDATANIVQSIAATDKRVRLLTAPPLPAGWCGKPHACHLLAQEAHFPVLLFMDADVRLAADAVPRLACSLKISGADLISGVPRQETGSWMERLLIPLIHFLLLGFLPIWRMRRSRDFRYGAGCGQLIMVRAEAYFKSGGYSAVRTTLHDGLNLPRAFRKAGFMSDLIDATALASCRMYHGARQVLAGLAKNATEGLAHPTRIVPATILLLMGQLLPWFLAPVAFFHHRTAFPFALIALLASVLPRFFGAARFRQSWTSALLHPLGIAILLGVQWFALARRLLNCPAEWKGRSYHLETSTPPQEPNPAC